MVYRKKSIYIYYEGHNNKAPNRLRWLSFTWLCTLTWLSKMHQSHVLQCVISSVCTRSGRVDFPGTILDEIIAVFCLEELEPPGEHPVYRCSAASRKFTGTFFELPLCPLASSCCRIVEELEPPGVHPVYRCSAAAWKFAGKFGVLFLFFWAAHVPISILPLLDSGNLRWGDERWGQDSLLSFVQRLLCCCFCSFVCTSGCNAPTTLWTGMTVKWIIWTPPPPPHFNPPPAPPPPPCKKQEEEKVFQLVMGVYILPADSVLMFDPPPPPTQPSPPPPPPAKNKKKKKCSSWWWVCVHPACRLSLNVWPIRFVHKYMGMEATWLGLAHDLRIPCGGFARVIIHNTGNRLTTGSRQIRMDNAKYAGVWYCVTVELHVFGKSFWTGMVQTILLCRHLHHK